MCPAKGWAILAIGLSDSDASVRSEAAAAIRQLLATGKAVDRRARLPLLEATRHDDTNIREVAAMALDEISE
jgi:hypothetical protein